MNITLITFVTPSSENIRGTSALPYHLIKGGRPTPSLPEGEGDIAHNFSIYTFNNNALSDEKIAEVRQELGAEIKPIPMPRWYQWMFRLHLLFLRIFMKYPFINYIKLPQKYVNEIKAKKPDLIWVMGEELSRIVKQFPNQRRIQIGPDTESLYYYRMMGRRFVMNNVIDYWKCAMMYRKYARMERDFCPDLDFTFYAVGEEDVRHLQQLNPKVQARFLRHPHYEVGNLSQKTQKNAEIKMNTDDSDNKGHADLADHAERIANGCENIIKRFHSPKIKVLIAGQYNLYMKQDADLLNEELRIKNEELVRHYTLTFLGKGWEKHVEAMRGAGYEVNHITFVPDYIEEICKHDIQITPISIGTGTKGKVLDALANGLLVIGTPYAMENIAVENGVSCIEYRQPKEVIEVLMDIPDNREKYERMADAGRQAVLTLHDRAKISKEIFNL